MKTTSCDTNKRKKQTNKQMAVVQFRVGHEYLLTSLASLAIKNPNVPSCIFTWFPGLIRILFNQKEMIVLVNRNLILKKFTVQCSNQEEWYTLRPSGNTHRPKEHLHWTATKQYATLSFFSFFFFLNKKDLLSAQNCRTNEALFLSTPTYCCSFNWF